MSKYHNLQTILITNPDIIGYLGLIEINDFLTIQYLKNVKTYNNVYKSISMLKKCNLEQIKNELFNRELKDVVGY
jgi:hypothetical protein